MMRYVFYVQIGEHYRSQEVDLCRDEGWTTRKWEKLNPDQKAEVLNEIKDRVTAPMFFTGFYPRGPYA